jgi:flagellar hook-associated protein 3 FlgL
MRVDPNYVLNLSSAISQSTASEASLTNELSTGLRVTQLGDDPVAATQALQLSSAVSRSDTFVQTASRESGILQVTDSTLSEVVTQLTSAVSLATQANNGTLNDENRTAIVNQLQGIQSQVLSLANTNYLGQYLFAGSKGTTKPFTLDASGAATYAGDSVQQSIETPGGQPVVTNLTGSSVFQSAGGSVFAALSSVIADISSDPVGTTLAADSASLTTALGQVSTQRSILGNSLARIQATSTYTQTQEANLKSQQSTLVSADAAVVATQLKSTETQHEALLSLVAALGKNSLFDYLK